MTKVLVDMNLSPGLASFLESKGVAAVHWSAVGKASASDASIMHWAREHDALVLTNDLDFGAILAATSGNRPSVLQIRVLDLSVERIGERLVAIIGHYRLELEKGALIVVGERGSRVRVLPIVGEAGGEKA